MNELQDLVDALAAELGRPVGLDDAHFRSVAYSSHVEELDQVRLSSILQRQAPKPVTEYLTSLRINEVSDHLRIPANPSLGMVARICLPVRFGGVLLGYVWLFDEPEPLGPDKLEGARRVAAEAGAVLYRLRRLERAGRMQERELLGRLLGVRHGDAREAAKELTTAGIVAPAALAHVAVLQATSAAGRAIDDAVRVRLAAAVDRLRRSAPPHQVISLLAGDGVAILLVVDGEEAIAQRAERLLEYATELLADDPQWTALVGISGPRPSLVDCDAAYEEALRAADVGRVEPRLAPVVWWERLGAFRTVLRLLGSAEPAALVPPSVRALLDAPDAAVLVPTLLAWLDSGGDAKQAAEELFIHRSSLYNRLHRVEAVTRGLLRSGDERLELHLGLRLWQLAGGVIEDRDDAEPPAAAG